MAVANTLAYYDRQKLLLELTIEEPITGPSLMVVS